MKFSFAEVPNSESSFGIVAQSPKPEYELDDDIYDQFYIPCRMISSINPHSCILLPRNSVLMDYVAWFNKNYYRSLYGSDSNVVWLDSDHYLLDDNISESVLSQIKTISSDFDSVTVFPYSLTPSFVSWFEKLSNPRLFGESVDFYDRNANKTILHPGISKLNLSSVDGLRIPKGISCKDLNDVRDAIKVLGSNVMIKEAFGAGGAGIFKYDDNFDFSLLTNFPYLVEQRLNLDTAHDGSELSLSVQFSGGKLCGVPTRQILHGTHNAGNVIGESNYLHLYDDVINQSQLMLDVLKQDGMQGLGGVDFLFQDGTAFAVDVNLGRPTACHPAWMFLNSHFRNGNKSNFATLELPYDKSINELWESVRSLNLDLKHDSFSGVFPLYHLQGMTSRWISLDQSGDKALENLYNLRELAL